MVAVEIGERWVDSHCVLGGAPTGLARVGGGAEEAVGCCSLRGLKEGARRRAVCVSVLGMVWECKWAGGNGRKRGHFLSQSLLCR